MIKKKGNITSAITLIVSLGFLVVIAMYIINTIVPFIWYQKLQEVANKYVYIIEKFGYLTNDEEKELYEDLKEMGFDIQNIKAKYPKEPLNYGTLFEFELKYDLRQTNAIISSGIKNEARIVSLKIKKYGYSKI